jgi:hypothetical protein
VFKLLSASVLALGALCAAPAAAQTVYGGHLYIQDFDAPVQITYLPSFANDTTKLYISTLDENGTMLNGWFPLFVSKGTGNDTASMGSCVDCQMKSTTYTFTPPKNSAELVFLWVDETTKGVYYSTVLWWGPSGYDQITYSSNNTATVGFEDRGPGYWDWNDVMISLTNVGSTRPIPTTTIPEPETWAMMLAGFGMVASVVRRRRNKVQ